MRNVSIREKKRPVSELLHCMGVPCTRLTSKSGPFGELASNGTCWEISIVDVYVIVGRGLADCLDQVGVHGMRFQNYRSIFTILDVATVSRKWIEVLYMA